MLYAIMAEDAPDSIERRAGTRPRHIEYLQPLIDDGRVVLAGPHPVIDSPEAGPAGYSGSLIVAQFASQKAAEEWAADDPYVKEGVFANVVIKPFLQVVP
jgi:uncharacterized protein YciI